MKFPPGLKLLEFQREQRPESRQRDFRFDSGSLPSAIGLLFDSGGAGSSVAEYSLT
jgi:hypothetical protein